MKRCPECRRDYYDDTLSFCLEDGSPLVSGVPAESLSGEEPATAVFPNIHTTEEARTRTFENETTQFTTSATKRNTLIAGAIGIVIVTAFGFGSYLYYGRTDPQISSIAVLPFVNESGNAEIEYLSDGMTETLINNLSQIPNLSVKARSSVFRYKGKEVDPQKIATDLKVQAILNGRVMQRGDNLTLNLEMVDASTGNQIWGEFFQGRIDEVRVYNRALALSEIQVDMVSKATWPYSATYGGLPPHLTFNVGRLGRLWFESGPNAAVDRLLIHELGHHYSSDHLSEEYHDALCKLGARLALLAIAEPEFFKRHKRVHEDLEAIVGWSKKQGGGR